MAELKIALFKNDKKGNERAPEYRGLISDGEKKLHDVSLWERTSPKGVKYLSGTVRDPYIPKDQPQNQGVDVVINNDDLPF